MNITKNLIITDTNIITNLHVAELLEIFIKLDNVFVSDIIYNDEIKKSTCSFEEKKLIKTIDSSEKNLNEAIKIQKEEKQLSIYDTLNYVLAKNYNAILATGDNKLKNFSEENNVKVFRTLKIISLLSNENIISKVEELKAYELLKKCNKTRIPLFEIENKIEELIKINC